jgi:hypothetical protein
LNRYAKISNQLNADVSRQNAKKNHTALPYSQNDRVSDLTSWEEEVKTCL